MTESLKLPFTIIGDALLIGRHTTISFNRTLRVPEDGKKYDLPAGFGCLPIIPLSDVEDQHSVRLSPVNQTFAKEKSVSNHLVNDALEFRAIS